MLTSPGLYQTLLGSAGTEISDALHHGKPSVCHPPTDEPSAVAAVAWAGIPDLVAVWRPHLRSLGSVAVHSVFVHGSPKVTFPDSSGTPTTVELGDLLLVVDETSGLSIVDRRAVLVQAKLFKPSGAFGLSGSGLDQLYLYQNWPIFNFIPKGYPGARDFCAPMHLGHPSESGCYGGIGGVATAPAPFEWEQIATASGMTRRSGADLADYLAGMIVGSAGRAGIAGGNDDWSTTIDDLLLVSAPATVSVTRALGAGNSHLRGVTSLTKSDGSPIGPDESHQERGGDGGISFVRVVISRDAGDD